MRKVIAAFAAGIVFATLAVQAAIPTGGGSSGPVEPTAGGIVGQVNAYLGNLVSLPAGATTQELQFFQAASWATNSNTATTMTSLGPQGASTTVSKWLTVKDNTGNPGFIPFYACGSSSCR